MSPGSGTIFAASLGGKERVIHRFTTTLGDRAEGKYPYAALTPLNGALYGTTLLGEYIDQNILGTAYAVTAAGGERLLHEFGHGIDGAYLYAGLTALNGTLYGETYEGGIYNEGTLFSLDPVTGKERVLHDFAGDPDGQSPTGTLVVVKGVLYGTTSGGGTNCGTVFSMTASGREHVLYDFKCSQDGAFPHAGLVALHGVLYGTTTEGGLSGVGYGTIFAVTFDGKETVLHTFTGYPDDAAYVYGPLIAKNGTLYGASYSGGSSTACVAAPQGYGCGTIFAVTPSGTITILYSFNGGSDGAFPYGGLIEVNGTLYGTTATGGGTACTYYYGRGCGTIFSVTASGDEKQLYAFKSGKDGANPFAGLTYFHGMLYGTTYYGGNGK
jgi:uncharacterized repeat protein (TIGR03803 family)